MIDRRVVVRLDTAEGIEWNPTIAWAKVAIGHDQTAGIILDDIEEMIRKCGKVTLEMGQDELEEPVMILRFAEGTNTYKVCLPATHTEAPDDTKD